MAKQRVSGDFKKWQEKTSNKLADSKKAENNTAGIPFPVGTSGICTIIDLVAGTTKSKNNPYMSIKAVTPDGKKFTKMYLFNETDNATGADRWSWMLNEFENMGMSREFREEKGDDAEALIDYFLAGEPIQASFEVVEDKYQQSGKRVNFGLADGVKAVEAKETIEYCTSAETLEVGKFLLWNDTAQKILKIEEGKVTVKSTTTNAQRQLEISELTF